MLSVVKIVALWAVLAPMSASAAVIVVMGMAGDSSVAADGFATLRALFEDLLALLV